MCLAFWNVIFILVLSSSSKDDCLRSGDSTSCCADFHKVDGKCTPCPSGSFGPLCSHVCPYPKYGRRCLEGSCNCPEQSCDPKTGCIKQKSEARENANEAENDVKPEGQSRYGNNGLKTEDNIIKEERSSSSPVLIALAVIGSFIIIALSAVIIFQVKGKIKIRNQRKSHVSSQRHVDTYCEIDESNLEEVECKLWSESEVYESIDHSRKDGTKYTALPSRSNNHKERATMSTALMQMNLHDVAGADKDKNEKDESKVQLREDKNRHRRVQNRMGKTSTKISGYIDMARHKLESYVSMTVENIKRDAKDSN